MKIIVDGDLDAISYLDELGYKMQPSLYDIEIPLDDGKLLYNTFTCRLVKLTEDEYCGFIKNDCLTEEMSIVKKYRELHSVREPVSKFVIFTTSECNARCFYCFEKDHKLKKHMSKSIARDTAEYIEKLVDNRKVHLSWFGGEPLMNPEAIDEICSTLASHNIDYYSSMITNASLIDESILKRMTELWNLRWLQITIDGTETVYNATKKYVYIKGEESPYKQVIKNIRLLLEKKIFVLISLRVSCSNGESLIELLDEIEKEFGENRYLSVMCAAIHEKRQDIYEPRTIEEERYVRKHQLILMEKAFEKGLFKPSLPRKPRIFHCNSDNGRELIILPNGNVGWCNNYLDSGYIGDIYSCTFDKKMIQKFQERYSDLEECKNCQLYPQCTRLKACEGSVPVCTLEQRKVTLRSLELAMKKSYLDHKMKHEYVDKS